MGRKGRDAYLFASGGEGKGIWNYGCCCSEGRVMHASVRACLLVFGKLANDRRAAYHRLRLRFEFSYHTKTEVYSSC